MKALVTGGGGFLGSAIVRQLRARGDPVRVLGRGRYPHVEQFQAECLQGDICDPAAVGAACRGVDVVFHVAAKAGIWGRREDFQRINVEGTRNVVRACFDAGVGRLIYTSSPSVVFGKEPLSGVDESQPYPSEYLADYPRTKAAAERLILAANGPALATVALRPHLIFGPGDPHLIPRLVDRARTGRLRQVGDGRNKVDVTYVDNAADAHLLAADALRVGGACGGRAYFISQGEPVVLWTWLNDLLILLGAPPANRKVSFPTAYALGAACEWVWRGLHREDDPPMTRFVATQFAHDHYFNISAARRDFGYQPAISTTEAVARLVAGREHVGTAGPCTRNAYP